MPSRFTASPWASRGSSEPGYESLVADFYRSKYAGRTPDLIVAVMEPPLDFLLRHADTVFPGVPIVFASIDAATIKDKTLPANVTGVLLKRTYSPTLEVALRLQPETRNVFVVGGASTFDRLPADLRSPRLAAFRRPRWHQLSVRSVHGRVAQASVEPARAQRNPLRQRVTDGAGRAASSRTKPCRRLPRSANAPVYVFLDQYVGLGAVGGNVYSFRTHGAQVAALGLEILRGASPASLPIRELGAQIDLFDARQLRRWNLDAARLPPGSEVRYRERSVWVLYRWYIIVAIAVLVTQGALIGGLLLARARQQRAEAEARRQRDDLAHLGRVALVGELSATLAHEMKQPLTAILTNARAAQQLLKADGAATAELREILEDIAADDQRAGEVIDHVRNLVKKGVADLQLLSINDVVSEVLELVRTDLQHRGVVVSTRLCEPMPLVVGDRVQLQQVVLNLVMNACDAMSDTPPGERLLVIATATHGDARIEVRDRGSGIAPDALARIFEPFVTTKRDGLGLGLAICRSIVTAHGGSLSAVNNPERGATFVVSLPLAELPPVPASGAVRGARTGSHPR